MENGERSIENGEWKPEKGNWNDNAQMTATEKICNKSSDFKLQRVTPAESNPQPWFYFL